MNTSTLKPINTVFSADSILDIKELVEAKILMNTEYGNQYTHIPPHIGYAIVPLPEENFEKAKTELKEYISKQKPFNISIADLIYEEKSNFFYVELDGDMLKKLHIDITEILNKYRGNYVREKDIDRLNSNMFDEKSKEYLLKYGYTRVFDNYRSHITVGNITVENVDIKKVENRLRDILSPILNKEILIENIHAVYHTDSSNQSEMRQIWEKTYKYNDTKYDRENGQKNFSRTLFSKFRNAENKVFK